MRITMIKIRPVKKEEENNVKLMVAKAFRKNNIEGSENVEIPTFIEQEIEDDQFFRALFLDNKPVSALKIIPFELEIENIKLRAYGLTGVSTNPLYQRYGFASMLLKDVLEFAREREIDFIVLHSAADNFYRKNGFGFAFMAFESKLKINDKKDLEKLIENINSFTNNIQLMIKHYNNFDKESFNKIIDLTPEIIEINNQSFLCNARKVKVIQKADKLVSIFKNLLKSREFYLSVLTQNENILAYNISIINNTELEFIDFNYKFNFSDLIIVWKSLLEMFCKENRVLTEIKIKTYSENLYINQLIEKIFNPIYPILLTGNMACITNPIKLMHKFIPIFNERIQKYNGNKFLSYDSIGFNLIIIKNCAPLELLEQNIRSSIYFEIRSSNLNIEEAKKLNFPNILMYEEEFTGLVFGYFLADELEFFDEISNETSQIGMIKEILKILFPPLNPVWNYINFY